MKHNLLKLGTLALALGTASLFAQDHDLHRNAPGGGVTRTNSNGLGAPGSQGGIISGGSTNAVGGTNGINRGAPGPEQGVDSGGHRSDGQAPVPSVGNTPSGRNAPSAPAPGSAPRNK